MNFRGHAFAIRLLGSPLRATLLRGLVCAALLWFRLDAMADPKPTLVDTVARLSVGQTKGPTFLHLNVEGLDAGGMAKAQIVSQATDLGMPAMPPPASASAPPIVKPQMEISEQPAPGTTTRAFLLKMEVDGLPANTVQSRFVVVNVGGKDVTLGYSLSNIGSDKFVWSVKPLSSIAISPGEPIPISISVGPVPAHGLKVFQSALIENSTKRLIAPQGLHVCGSSTEDCKVGDFGDLPANSARQLWLWGATEVGQFAGSVTLSAADKPDGDAAQMTVYSSTGWHKFWGVIAILVGVAFTWLATVFVRNKINRDQLLAPVTLALETLVDVEHAYNASSHVHAAPHIAVQIVATRTYLSESNLEEHGLPAAVPSFSSTSSASISDFKTYAQAGIDWITDLGFLVREGLIPAWDAAGAPDANQRVLAPTDAVDQIDALVNVAAAPPLDALHTALMPIVTALAQRKPIGPALVGAIGASAGAAPALPLAMKTPAQLHAEIGRLSLEGWAFAIGATTLAGAYILVLGPNAAGFGTAMDYLQCLLWGIGLPAGAQLMQSTTSSISTTLGVPKY